MDANGTAGGNSAPKLAALGVLGENGEMPGSYEYLQFHPNELTVVSANNYQDQTAFGAATPVRQYTGGKTRTLTATFFFDTTNGMSDVRDNTRCVTDMLARKSGASAPPVCVFVYGAFMFIGVVESATQKFLMFSRDGKPVRSTIDVSLSEYRSMSGDTFMNPAATEQKTVAKASDEELYTIAGREYGDETQWRQIADKNNIANPRMAPDTAALIV